MNALKHYASALVLSLALSTHANTVKIVDAKATNSGDSWTIAVTLNHADMDRNHYANIWRVVTEDGKILGTRELGHPHKEQPFTRSLEGVQIPESLSAVYIEAHDNVHGWSEEKFKITLKSGLKIGDKAPTFNAVDQDGTPWSLKDHLGGKYLVLYFYPAAMTGGCTKQACSYRDYVENTPTPNIEIVGISCDTPENLKHFRQAENLNFTLLADPDGAIAQAFGVPVRSGEKSIKRTVEGQEVELSRSNTAARWTFIIDSSGNIVYRNTQVKVMKDIEDVLAFLQKNSE